MGFLLDLFGAFGKIGKNIKTWMLISEHIDKLAKSTSECESNIKGMQGSIQSLATNYSILNEYGSKSVNKSIATIHEKIDGLDAKLGVVVTTHGERLSRIEGIVLNGHYPKEK